MDNSRSTRRRFLASAGLALSATTAGCALNPPSSSSSNSVDSASGFPDDPEEPPETESLQANSPLTEVYQDVVDSVAAVSVELDDVDPVLGQNIAGGTAWVYEDDYLVTNDHVVSGGSNAHVWFDGTGWREAEIVGTDFHSDLAVLQVRNRPESATPLPVVDEPQPVGSQVAAIGNPFELTGSFTTGVISGRNRRIQAPDRNFSIADGIQTDAALNPGNSGGPLITHDGRVVGVISAGMGENIGFAISAAMLEQVVPSLIEHGEYEHTYLGIASIDVNPQIIEANDLGGVTWGVYVDRVPSDGPSADRIRPTQETTTIRDREVPVGGDVIVRMDDWTIQTGERLSAFLALETEPGDTIEIEVIRDGERETVDVTLGSRDDASV